MKTPNKKNLRKQADELWRYSVIKKWGQYCTVCGKIGVDVHHFFPRHAYPRLRHEVNNGIITCRGCHFKHHFWGDPVIHQTIIKKRARAWYNKLEKISKQKFISGNTIEHYQKVIEKLKKIIIK